MLLALVVSGLISLAAGGEPPVKGEAGAAETGKVKPGGHAKGEETSPVAKPARRRPSSPAVPEAEEKAATPAPAAASAAPHTSIGRRRVVPTGIPGVAQAPSASDARAARLESENAKLRQQLAQTARPPAKAIVGPAAALAELVAGNLRFVDGTRVRTLLSMQDADLRATLAKGQAPFAVIITCSDSRLADNLIFDQELGRLFTIREAGNSPDTQSLASVEYAIEHLKASLVVIMGHTQCGAVQAVSDAHGKPLPGNLWSLQAAMSGLLESVPVDPNEPAGAHMTQLIRTNAQRQAQAVLDRSELVRESVAKGLVKVVAALYDLASGKVIYLPMPTVAAGPVSHQ